MKNIFWLGILATSGVLVMVLESTAGYMWLGFVVTWLVAQSLSPAPAWVWMGVISWIMGTILQLPFTLVATLVIGGWWLWLHSKTVLQIPTLRMIVVSGLGMFVLLIWQKVAIQPLVVCSMVGSLMVMLLLFRWWWRRMS